MAGRSLRSALPSLRPGDASQSHDLFLELRDLLLDATSDAAAAVRKSALDSLRFVAPPLIHRAATLPDVSSVLERCLPQSDDYWTVRVARLQLLAVIPFASLLFVASSHPPHVAWVKRFALEARTLAAYAFVDVDPRVRAAAVAALRALSKNFVAVGALSPPQVVRFASVAVRGEDEVLAELTRFVILEFAPQASAQTFAALVGGLAALTNRPPPDLFEASLWPVPPPLAEVIADAAVLFLERAVSDIALAADPVAVGAAIFSSAVSLAASNRVLSHAPQILAAVSAAFGALAAAEAPPAADHSTPPSPFVRALAAALWRARRVSGAASARRPEEALLDGVCEALRALGRGGGGLGSAEAKGILSLTRTLPLSAHHTFLTLRILGASIFSPPPPQMCDPSALAALTAAGSAALRRFRDARDGPALRASLRFAKFAVEVNLRLPELDADVPSRAFSLSHNFDAVSAARCAAPLMDLLVALTTRHPPPPQPARTSRPRRS